MKNIRFTKDSIERKVNPKFRARKWIRLIRIAFIIIETAPILSPFIFLYISFAFGFQRNTIIAGTLVLTIIALIFIYYTIIKFRGIYLKEYRIDIGLGKQIKIIFLADLHLANSRYGTKAKRLDNLIKTINNEKPEVVIFGGDILDEVLDASLISHLSQIKANYKLGVYGNHDTIYLSENPKEREFKIPYKFVDLMKQSGIKILLNAGEMIEIDGAKLFIGGITDLYSKNFDLEKAFEYAPKNVKRVLVSHNPDIVDFIEENDDIDLILCGHNHGGQINIKPLGAILPIPAKHKEFQKGEYYINKLSKLFITEGVGFSGTRLRIGTMPEVCRLIIT